MGRELRRKEAKKNKKQQVKTEVELESNISWLTFFKLAFFILLLLFVIYYVLAVFVTKELDISNGNDDKTEEVNNSDSVSDKILAANIFNQTDNVYYVYFYDFNSKDSDNLSDLISSSVGENEKVYKVDTSSGLNSKYVTNDKGNVDAKKLEDLKVIRNTLIKIDNDEIVEYFEGKSAIISGIKG